MHDDMTSRRLPELGAPPRSLTPLRLYLATQWRRAFGVNLSRVDDLLFVGGQFRPAQWPQIHALGVRAVLSLQAERADEFCDPLPARSLRLEVIDFQPPSLEQLRAAVDFISAAHVEGYPVLVHCHGGVGRAPLTASAYLMSRGLSLSDALARIRQARPIIGLNARQLARLREWELELGRTDDRGATTPE